MLLGTSRNSAQHAMTKAGIRMSPVFCLHTDEELQIECDSHPDVHSMAKKWGMHFEVVRKIMRARGIRMWRVKFDFSDIPLDTWMRMYQEAHYSHDAMAGDLGCHRQTVWREFQRRGIHVGAHGKPLYPWNKEELEYLYNVKRLGYGLIARVYGSTVKGAEGAFKRFKCRKIRAPICVIGQKGCKENAGRGAMARDGHFKMARPNRLPSDDGWDTLPLALRERFGQQTKGGVKK